MKRFLVSILVLVFVLVPIVSSALTPDELKSQIASLLQQIQQLKTQLAQMQSGGGASCHDFSSNLKIGDQSDEVSTLLTYLVKNGVASERSSNFSNAYDEQMASYVTAFQEKYVSEVLNPVALTHGTGYLGARTRAKLNQLYGCEVTKPVMNSPVISGIEGPQTLNVNQQGTWSVTAYDQNKGIGNLSYSVVWGDEGGAVGPSAGSPFLPQQSATFTHTYLQAGNYTPRFTVTNFDGKTAQTSLSVKVGSTVTPVPTFKPDITVTGVSCNPANPKIYEPIICSVTVYNNSPVSITKPFDVNIQGTAVTVSAPLNAYESRTVKPTAGFSFTAASSNTLNFPVDIWNSIDESNENNNMFSMIMNISGDKTPNQTITVLSPNGGESFQSGVSQTISWTTPSLYIFSGNFDVILHAVASGNNYVIKQNIAPISSDKQSISWTPVGPYEKDTQFVIQVCRTGTSICDQSDTSFTILSNASQPSIHITGTSGNQTSDSSINVNIGDTFTISGVPQNIQGLSYYYGSGYPTSGYYNRAFIFNQEFGNNNSCGNNEAAANGTWTMTCTAKVSGSSNFFIEIYANGQTYRSNGVNVNVLAVPQATSLSTYSAPVGSQIVVYGKNFDQNTYVQLGGRIGTTITPTSVTFNSLTITIPDIYPSSNNFIQVGQKGGVSWSLSSPLYLAITSPVSTTAPTPTISSLSSYSVPAGNQIVVYGINFDQNTYVQMDGRSGISITPTSITSNYFTLAIPASTYPSTHSIQVGQTNGVSWSNSSPVNITVTDSTPVASNVSLVAPNGGEVWKVGSNNNIAWNKSSNINTVEIQLYKAGNSVSVITTSATGNNFTWTIPAGTVPGNDYKIVIFGGGSAMDYSNNSFTISS